MTSEDKLSTEEFKGIFDKAFNVLCYCSNIPEKELKEHLEADIIEKFKRFSYYLAHYRQGNVSHAIRGFLGDPYYKFNPTDFKLWMKYFSDKVYFYYKNGKKWIESRNSDKPVVWTKDYVMLYLHDILWWMEGKELANFFKYANDIYNWPEDRIKD